MATGSMRRVSTKIFLTFAVALIPFGMVAAFGIGRLHGLGRDLRLISQGYLPLTRIAAQIDVKDWVTSRVLEASTLDPAARRAYLPVARAHFPALVREKIAEGREVIRQSLTLAGKEDARFLADVAARLDGLDARWTQYDAAASALFDALERGEGDRLEQRTQSIRTLEKGLSLDVKLLAIALESQIGDRVHAAERAESRTVAAIIIYSLLAAAIGLGAVVISQRLLAPIRTLTEGVKAVAAGDLTRKVEVPSGDEIGMLAREFNAMAASLDRQRQELLRAERLAAVGRISAHITHEIRNPLNAIGLNTELLAEEIERLAPESTSDRSTAEEARALVEAIGREVDRLNGVAEEYLRFSRLPKRQLAHEDLNEVLGGLLDFLEPEMAAARVELRRELVSLLPPVQGDESQLRAAFLNLLRNSREAMPTGGRVTIRTRSLAGWVGVEIEDTGGGIPPGEMPRIFDPFYSTKERGTGLGLAFTQQVVQEHGGTIVCRSQAGKGTVFEVRLPAATEERETFTATEAAGV
jgi:two-component system, NtrC family, sensor kinase